jgi:DNA-binding transcriptional LysR family regulator
MRYTLRQLEIFVAVSRLDSVSKASELLCLSQSATSTSLGEFERQFGLQLFDRIGRSLSINESGKKLLPKAVELLDRAKEIESELSALAGFGEMHIGATLTIGNYLANLLVAKFLQTYPDSNIKLQVHNTKTIIQQIINHELDLGMIEGDCDHPDLEVQPWIADELVIFSAPNHPLTKEKNINIDTLIKQVWILREKGSGTRETFDRVFGVNEKNMNIRLELEHTEAIKRAVESGIGIGCISKLALKDAFRRGSLVALDVKNIQLNRYFYFLWPKSKYQTNGMKKFLKMCRDMTAGLESSDQINLPLIA